METINILENGLIPVFQVKDSKLVNGRDLHEFLEVGTKFTDWIKERIEKYGFVENEDFFTTSEKREVANGGFKMVVEYLLKLDTAKEISMVQNNEKGSQARKYFIEVEKKFKEIVNPQSIEDLIIMQAQRMKDIRLQIQQAKDQSAAIGEAVQEIREVIVVSPQADWREQTNKLVAKICKKLDSYNLPKETIYKALEVRAKCDLKIRLENKIRRLIREGISKSKAEKLNYLDVITDDSKLIEIYTAIVKEMAIKNKVA
ncbi:MAG: antA/AntB antirepressor family protein [Clostridiaceae bacterium]|nr:antA/AntB antirepressor family protein [Clostridiaceae bacterium]